MTTMPRVSESLVWGVDVSCLVVQVLIFGWIGRSRVLALVARQRVVVQARANLLIVWRWPWLRAGAVRAVIETSILQIGLTAGLFGLSFSYPPSEYGHIISSLVILDGPCCILWCALRLRLPAGAWWRKGLYEGAVAGSLGLAMLPLLVIGAFITLLLKRDALAAQVRTRSFPALLIDSMAHYQALQWVLLFIFVGVLIFFLMCRGGARLWLRWNRMRRTRLRWALTHAHLLVVVIGAALLGVLMVGVDVLSSTGFPFYLLSIVLAMTIFTGIALALVLPPSALFSYLFARRMTRRIEALARATSALRQGNYAIRVPVKGEDEIARLQADFNAMAADLERTMRELQAERDAVATLLKARRELVASVSHELRTPIATLRGYLESTRAHWDETPPPTLRQDLQIMEQETIRLQTLIDDLFTLARAEVRKLEVRSEPVDTGALVRRVAETLAPLAWQAGRVEVIADAPSETAPVFADPCRLEQALQNLAHNGVRHTPPGGIVALLVRADAEGVSLQVRDTGEGIASADLPRIWERFYRAENSRARSDGGSGLGLALVKELTEAMGGSVAVESTPGDGSCFTLRFPTVEPGREVAPLAEVGRQVSRSALTRAEPAASVL